MGRDHAHRKPRQAVAPGSAEVQRKGRASSWNYKAQSNSVAAFDEAGQQVGIVFETATPFDTPRLMEEVVGWTTGEFDSRELHPLLVTAIFIVVFLEIHPFQDGNGRLSRILTTLLLLRAGYSYVPYSSLESVVEQSKEGYYLALRQT
jgi:Fic family protein